ncbi:MAG: polysaccharide biosynthesis protein [Proteobacteria bacterium]|nr:polysaccharide biosynthesis protein [Pseudomonadota bacterium]
MSSVRRSLLFSLTENYLGMVLQLASSLVIARLLTPTEIGIFAVAAVLSALASTFRDFGVAEYLIQEKNLTRDKIRAAFAANLAVSWLMAAGMFFGSSVVGEFYRQDGVAEVMRVQSISFLLIPFGAVTMAYFRRELNYQPILVAGVFSNVVAFAVAVGGAWLGFSYMSLAWSSLAGVVAMVAVSVFMRPKDFPRWPGLKGIREVVHFGKHASGIYLFGQLGRNAPEAVIGKVLDMASVAFFSRANGLLELFNRTVLRAVTPVCLPYFSQAARAGIPVREGYLKAVALITGIGWPFFVAMGFSAYSVILFIYGDQWMTSVPFAQILCLAAMIELPFYLATEVIIAEGRIDESNRLQFFVQLIRVCSLVLVIPFGLLGASWGLVGGALLGAFVAQLFLLRLIGMHVSQLFRACIPSLRVTLSVAIPEAVLFFSFEQTQSNFLYFLLAFGSMTVVVWLAALKYWRHPFWDEIRRIWLQVRGRFSA